MADQNGHPMVEQMAQAIVQMQQQMQLLMQNQQQFVAAAAAAAQLQPLQQQPPAEPIAPGGAGAAAARPSGPRLPPPKEYDGKAAALEDWLADLQQQFDWYGTADEADRLRLAAACLRGAAREWWAHLATQPASWAALCEAIRARFQPINRSELARARLTTMAQGKQQSVYEYADAFRRQLAYAPTMAEEDRLFHFTRGLKPAIGMQVRIQGCKTLAEAIATATRAGGVGELGAALAGAAAGAAAGHGDAMDLNAVEGLEQEDTADSSSSSKGGAPVTRAELLELLNAVREQSRGDGGDRGRRPPPPISWLSEKEVLEHMAAGKCFSCGSTAHRSLECPKSKYKKRQGN
jgi:hypothetical protein